VSDDGSYANYYSATRPGAAASGGCAADDSAVTVTTMHSDGASCQVIVGHSPIVGPCPCEEDAHSTLLFGRRKWF
jgi:hypothetical protein